MTSDNLKTLVQLAQRHPGPISDAVRAAAYQDLVHPGLLQDKLQAAGFSGAMVQRGQRFILQIKNEEGELVAQANAPSPEDAILHAVLGYLREREIESRPPAAE